MTVQDIVSDGHGGINEEIKEGMINLKLTINGMTCGECKTYHQNRTLSAWIFEMENGTEIIMPFINIKLFTSSGSLDILTNTKSGTSTGN